MDKTSCRYCGGNATCVISWFRGAFGKPGPVRVLYCGKCDIKAALAKRGMTAPVVEGEDYAIEPLKALSEQKVQQMADYATRKHDRLNRDKDVGT